jgi:hypothetical protein
MNFFRHCWILKGLPPLGNVWYAMGMEYTDAVTASANHCYVVSAVVSSTEGILSIGFNNGLATSLMNVP